MMPPWSAFSGLHNSSLFTFDKGFCGLIFQFAMVRWLPPPLQPELLLGFALRDSAVWRPRQGRRARGAARSRVGPPESVAPAAPSDPERR